VKVAPLPDVVGMPGMQATQLLQDAGYTVVTEAQPDNRYPPGTVLEQFPFARAAVTEGTEVTLTLAVKPARGVVPSALNLEVAEATTAIEDAGFTARVVVEAEPPPGDGQRAGRVWKQTPVAGTLTNETTVVTIWVNP
jgi:serine/threonine-protein kinase